jgi:WD40 repeat protein
MLCVGEESNFLLENLSDHRVLKIIEGQTESYISSSWSPDSKWLAYFRNTAIRFPNAPGGNGTGEIILVDVSCLDSTSSCPLKKIGPFALQDEPIYGQGPLMWSPDSRYFAFPTGMMGLPILIFDTSEERFSRINVGDNQNAVNGMAWSPDGKWIACSFGIEIHLVPAQGGNTVKLVGGDREMRVIGWLSTYSKPVFQKENHLFITGAGNNIRIRQSPSLQGMVVKQLISGDRVQIIDGPVEANGYRWWKLKVEGNGTVGWAVENPDWYAMEK